MFSYITNDEYLSQTENKQMRYSIWADYKTALSVYKHSIKSQNQQGVEFTSPSYQHAVEEIEILTSFDTQHPQVAPAALFQFRLHDWHPSSCQRRTGLWFSGRLTEERWTVCSAGVSQDSVGSNFTAELRSAAYWTGVQIDVPRWRALTQAEMVSVSICFIFSLFTPLLSDSLPWRHPSFQFDSTYNRLSWQVCF